MQNRTYQESSPFLFTSRYAAKGAKSGALLGAGIGLTVTLAIAAANSQDTNFKLDTNLFYIALGGIGGLTAGAVIGGTGGAAIGLSVDLISAGASFSLK